MSEHMATQLGAAAKTVCQYDSVKQRSSKTKDKQ